MTFLVLCFILLFLPDFIWPNHLLYRLFIVFDRDAWPLRFDLIRIVEFATVLLYLETLIVSSLCLTILSKINLIERLRLDLDLIADALIVTLTVGVGFESVVG